MTTKYVSIRLTEEVVADLRRFTGERMAGSADGRVTMSEALRDALAVARGFESGKVIDPESEGWELLRHDELGLHAPGIDEGARAQGWAPCRAHECGGEYRRGVAGWFQVPGFRRIT